MESINHRRQVPESLNLALPAFPDTRSCARLHALSLPITAEAAQSTGVTLANELTEFTEVPAR